MFPLVTVSFTRNESPGTMPDGTEGRMLISCGSSMKKDDRKTKNKDAARVMILIMGMNHIISLEKYNEACRRIFCSPGVIHNRLLKRSGEKGIRNLASAGNGNKTH